MKAIQNNIYILKLVHTADNKRIVLTLIMFLWRTFVDLVFGALLLRYLLNSFQIGTPFMHILLVLVILWITQMGYSFFSNYYSNIFIPISDERIFQFLQKKVFLKSKDMELSSYDNPEYYDNFVKAANEVKDRAINSLNIIMNIISCVISLITLSIVMVKIGVIVVLISLIPVIVNLLVGRKLNKKIYDSDMSVVKYTREKDYVNRTFFLKDYCKEIKLSNIHKVLFSQFDNAINNIISIRKEYGFGITLYKVFLSFVSEVVCYFGAIFYACYLFIFAQKILLGDFTFIIASLSRLTQIIQKSIDLVFEIHKSAPYIDNLKIFLANDSNTIKSGALNIDNNIHHSLVFKDVTFRYNENLSPVLKNINLSIRSEEKIAIVGHNGAGKSTFVKLLLGLYTPTDGEVLLDNINIQKYNLTEYRNLFGCVFQDFATFGVSLAENVLCREVTAEDESKIVEALGLSGLYDDIKEAGYSIHSIVTKEFDENGINLSGGQMQKLAIARAFIANNKVIVLDEPTSALDPISEYNMFESIKKLYKDKTVIFISHRLSSALLADTIYFFENGTVIEQGSHKELMALNKKYAYMFNLQASSYRDNTEDQV